MQIQLKKKIKDASYSLEWDFTRGNANLKILIGEFVRYWTLSYFRKKSKIWQCTSFLTPPPLVGKTRQKTIALLGGNWGFMYDFERCFKPNFLNYIFISGNIRNQKK